ncbi:MAG: site-2 protease family protein [Chloroflexi bacterium]|nr:site-2 protease family protein [Chloroflexota bacterium]
MLKGGIPLGRPFGISVRLHWSWFIVFVYVTWSLAMYYFPQTYPQKDYPQWNETAYVVAGLATSSFVFLSVLAHEMAHSLVGRSVGVNIDSITLFVFGGVARMTEEPKKPGVEFRMAVAGPATSLALAGAFWAIRSVTLDVSEPVAAVASWLGWINLSLAAFNMIPAFPLDGGRVLRSIIWWRSGSLLASTRTASKIGRGTGYLFIFGGLVWMFLGDDWFSGLWLAFIGWFLQNAAAGSYRQLAVDQMLRGHTVSEVMVRGCEAVAPDLTIERLVQDHILPSGRGCFSVVDNAQAVGLVTMENVKAVPRQEWPTRTVGQAMTPVLELRAVKADADLSAVLRVLMVEDMSELPVVYNNAIIGTVGRDNLQSFIKTRSELGV